MFDVGRDYEIHYLAGGAELSSTYRVEQWQAPLLRVSKPGAAEIIFNTASHNFLRATPQASLRDDASEHIPVEAAEMDVVAAGIA